MSDAEAVDTRRWEAGAPLVLDPAWATPAADLLERYRPRVVADCTGIVGWSRTTAERLERHLDFLGSSLRLNAPEVFTNYAVWDSSRADQAAHPGLIRAELQALMRALSHLPGAEVLHQAKGIVHAASYLVETPSDWDDERDPREAPSPDAAALATALLQGESVPDTFERLAGDDSLEARLALLAEAMVQVGEHWFRGEVSAVEEHMATERARRLVAELAQRHEASAGSHEATGHVLLACVPGNRHALGLDMLAARLGADGWLVDHAGADVPMEALLDRIRRTRPTCVALSVAMPRDAVAVQRIAQFVQSDPEIGHTPILVGGALIGAYPALLEGIDGVRSMASVDAAMSVLYGLTDTGARSGAATTAS